MKQFFSVMLFMQAFLIGYAESFIESFNEVSDSYVGNVHDITTIRNINGGTVIVPEFDSSCPEEMKGAFSYACKIVEEYMPPCMPLKVAVSCGRVNGSQCAISSVKVRNCIDFGHSPYRNVPMSVVKGVILAELCYDETVSYLRYVPNLEFLTDLPDIRIVYNQQKLDEISFSLDATSDSKYDFVSLVIRDLCIGLGISSSYTYNYVEKCLKNPSQSMTPFESAINAVLGHGNDSIARLAEATRGELLIRKNGQQSLKLYAPNPWENGVSLNYFIPQSDCSLSEVMSYEFGKGTITRSLNDDGYTDWIFRTLLGWNPNYTVSSNTPVSSISGSTSLLMPYNGSINMSKAVGVSYIVDKKEPMNKSRYISTNDENLNNYIDSFHPFLDGGNFGTEGTSMSVLKKDGSWDLVKFEHSYIPDMTYNMMDWTFHYDDEEYARTIDGYLRARVTTKHADENNRLIYRSTFFVVDYLPQKTGVSFSYSNESGQREDFKELAKAASIPVRLYFSNLEGTKRLVLERLREGFRMPSKMDIPDFRCGYFDTTIDRNTTFTAVAYNDNGHTRSVPVKIEMRVLPTSYNFKYVGNSISIHQDNGVAEEIVYQINHIVESDFNLVLQGTTHGDIDVSNLSKGKYILVVNPYSQNRAEFRFIK